MNEPLEAARSIHIDGLKLQERPNALLRQLAGKNHLARDSDLRSRSTLQNRIILLDAGLE